MDPRIAALGAAGIRVYEASITALDAYRAGRRDPGPAGARIPLFGLAECGLVDLAKAAGNLRYPALPYADAAIDCEPAPDGGSAGGLDPSIGPGPLYLRCADRAEAAEPAAFAPLDLLRDPARGVYLDPKDVYGSLRAPRIEMRSAGAEEQLFQAAILLARHDYEIDASAQAPLPRTFPAEAQRDLLMLLLTGARPERGLEFLRSSGFIAAYWPELESLCGLDQSKDHHPEGDAWAHTLETFRHRKVRSLDLSLALLLHDAGKPRAESAAGRRFDRHAEIGRAVAERFMRRLGFDAGLVDDVSFLVRYHMMPAALPRLPASRMEGIIDDVRFPLLLELYKCDELSTFRGPDGFYEACAAYKAWLRNARNPWRDAEGRKLALNFLEDPRSRAPAARTGPGASHGRR